MIKKILSNDHRDLKEFCLLLLYLLILYTAKYFDLWGKIKHYIFSN